MEKKKIDWKMWTGVILILAVFVVIAGSFWNIVRKQAQQIQKMEAEEEEHVISAIYIQTGEILTQNYFVELDTEMVFTAPIPEEGIYHQNGTILADNVLEHGDLVQIYGDGAMTRSLPAQYPGVTKIKRVGRASLEETDRYTKAAEKYLKRE